MPRFAETVILAALALLAGCTSATPHPWQVEGTDRGVMVSTASWTLLPKEQYCRVAEARIEAATALLAEKSFVPLTPADARDLTACERSEAGEGLAPYLVRGMAYGGMPTYTIVRFDEKSRRLVVHRATYNGENLITEYAVRKPMPCPIVVWLPVSPAEVYPTAAVGGDWIFMAGT